MIHTTLNRILACEPCGQDKGCGYGFDKLLTYLGKESADDEPLSFLTILESNGLDDAIWCMRAEPDYAPVWKRFALECARRVEHLSDDPRVKACNDTTERYLNGEATESELKDASRDAARVAALHAWAAWDAARAAALHDRDAARVALAAALNTASAARAAELQAQEEIFKRLLQETRC